MSIVTKLRSIPVPVEPHTVGYRLELTVAEAVALVSWLGKVSVVEKEEFGLSTEEAKLTEKLFFNMDMNVERTP